MTQQSQELSLTAAIIINLNIIIGSGIFINTTELAKQAGVLGGLSYAIVGLLLLPLILSFAQLLHLYPGGGFYDFCNKSLHPFVGFMSTWCYFVTKLSSATLVIHVFILLMQKTFLPLAHYNPILLDMVILFLLSYLSMLNVKTGSSIQNYLMILKVSPLFLVLISGFFFLQGTNIAPIHHLWSGIPATIPLVLHAMLGFEAACSINRNIKNPEINGPKAIMISYGIVVLLYVLYQTIFYAILGSELATQTDYRGAFPLLISKCALNDCARNILENFIHLAIASSALSAGLGMIYSNMWNLYSLAEHQLIPGSSIIMKKNRFNVPFMCVLFQAILSFLYMILINGEQKVFQQLSALGATTTYSLSILGLLVALCKTNKKILLPVLGLINCCILLSASLYTAWSSGNIKPFLIFFSLLIAGAIIYKSNNTTLTNN